MQNWSQASDDEVERRLSETLSDLAKGSAPSFLHTDSATTPRDVYLKAVKVFHPNRFARRPKEIQKLSNEVFLALTTFLTKAPSKSESASASMENSSPKKANSRDRLKEARAKASRARRRSSKPVPAPKVEQAKKEPRKKTPTSNEAQLRIEARFLDAKQSLQDGMIEQALDDFRALAVEVPMDKRFRLYMHVSSARVCIRQKNFDKAESELKRALALDDQSSAALSAQTELNDAKKKNGIFSRLFKR